MAAGLLGPIMSLLHSTIVFFVFFSFVPHWLSYFCVGQPSVWCLCHFGLPTCLFAHHEAPLPLSKDPGRTALGHWLPWFTGSDQPAQKQQEQEEHPQVDIWHFKSCFELCYCCLCCQKWEQTGLWAQSAVSFTPIHKPHIVKEIWRAKARRFVESKNVSLNPDASRRIKNGCQSTQSRISMSNVMANFAH